MRRTGVSSDYPLQSAWVYVVICHLTPLPAAWLSWIIDLLFIFVVIIILLQNIPHWVLHTMCAGFTVWWAGKHGLLLTLDLCPSSRLIGNIGITSPLMDSVSMRGRHLLFWWWLCLIMCIKCSIVILSILPQTTCNLSYSPLQGCYKIVPSARDGILDDMWMAPPQHGSDFWYMLLMTRLREAGGNKNNKNI